MWKRLVKSKYAKYLLWLFFAATAIAALVFFGGSWTKNVFVLAVIGVMTFLFVRALKTGADKVLTLFGPTLLAALKLFSQVGFVSFLRDRMNAFLRWLGLESQIDNETTLILLFFIVFLLALYFKNRFADRPKKSFDRSLTPEQQKLCEALEHRMEQIAGEMDWSESAASGDPEQTAKKFTPMDAEVEVRIGTKRKKRYDDLLKCLKKNRKEKTVFLVKGDPGSGKSVAMRKLCADLMKDVETSGRIPVYINLKHWTGNWSVKNLPSVEELAAFIRRRLCEEISEPGDTVKKYLESNFTGLVEDGKLYFLFDSFDEIPCLMGKDANDELIDGLSKTISAFLKAGRQDGGVVASRYYHAPREENLGANVTLWIQAFDAYKIRTMMEKYLGKTITDQVCPILFTERDDLVRLCANPFYLTLLINYVARHGSAIYSKKELFPENQMKLFEAFINSRLSAAVHDDADSQRVKKLREAAREISVFMQGSGENASDCHLSELSKHSGKPANYWQEVTGKLEDSKLIRIDRDSNTFTFVHRRFQEFFLVEHLLDAPHPYDAEMKTSITSGVGLWDAFVLYCQVAEQDTVREIAGFCWDVVNGRDDCIRYSAPEKRSLDCRCESIANEGSFALYNTLNFMAEAFRYRPDALSGFIEDFETQIIAHLDGGTDLILATALVNSVVLFRRDSPEQKERLQNTVLQAFELNNRWINDIIMQNCRMIGSVNRETEYKFLQYFRSMSPRQFFKRFRNLRFSLSFSEGFKHVRRDHLMCMLWYLSLCFSLTAAMSYLLWKVITIPGLTLYHLLFVTIIFDYVSYGMYLAGIAAVMLNGSSFVSCHPIVQILDQIDSRSVALIVLYSADVFIALFLSRTLLNALGASDNLFWAVLFLLLPLLTAAIDLYPLVRCRRINALLLISIACLLGTIFMAVFFLPTFFERTPETIINLSNLTSRLFNNPIFLTIYFGLMLLGPILFLIFYLRDRRWVNQRRDALNHLSDRTVDRAWLEQSIKKLKTGKACIDYLTLLKQYDVKLTGEWPSSVRPRFNNEDVNILLAELDLKSFRAALSAREQGEAKSTSKQP